jgi:hypothetical protein
MRRLKLSDLPKLESRYEYTGSKHIYGMTSPSGKTTYPHVVRYREYGFYDKEERYTGNDQYREPRQYGAPIVGTHLDAHQKDHHAKPMKRLIF